MTTQRYLFTSESVSMGHPDKVADQISDAILDHCLAADPTSRVACETLVTTDLVVVAGEITTKAELTPAVAGDEPPTLIPLPTYLAHRLMENHARLRRSGELKCVRPDAKSQVTVEYQADGTPHRIHTVVISTQHDDSVVTKKNNREIFSDEARK